MTKKFIKVFTFLILSTSISIAADTSVQLKDYEGFQNNWEQLTVRFREDSGEMRFVWGNKKAMQGLESGKGAYEKGSVFSKISFKTQDDPAFTSSKVPSGTRRVQLMIRDEDLYAGTDGWGYFLFDSMGKPVKTDENACAACHRVVPDRGFVFSQKVELANIFSKQASSLPLAIPESKVVFENTGSKSLPTNFIKYLPPISRSQKLRRLMQPWFKTAFEGTADEIRPLLTKEATRSSQAAFFLSPDQKVLSFVTKYKSAQKCDEGQISMRSVVVFVPSLNDGFETRSRELDYCAVKTQ